MMVRTPRLLLITTSVITLRAFLVPYARHFRALGWQVDAAAGTQGGALDGLEDFGRIHKLNLFRSPWRTGVRSVVRTIREVVAQGRYDLVHVHTPIAAFLTRYALRQSSVPVVYTAHGFHFFPGGGVLRNAVYQWFERSAQPWTNALVVLNAHDHAAAIDHLGFRADRVVQWPGIGVDVNALGALGQQRGQVRDSLRRSLGLTEEAFVFVYPAEFNPGKRHVDLLRAFAGLSSMDSVLLLAGSGPRDTALVKFARTLGVEERVRFLGHRRDLANVLCASDCMVFPSEREGLSRSVLEAMAIGCPVIGSSARGVADLLADACGWIFPVGDVSAMRKLMEHACRSPAALAAVAASAQRRVAAYDTSVLVGLHERLYRSVLEAVDASA